MSDIRGAKGYWLVRWRIPITNKYGKRYLLRSKRFPLENVGAAQNFMACRIDERGLRNVKMMRISPTSARRKKAIAKSRHAATWVAQEAEREARGLGCGPKIAPTLAEEDFGSFAGIGR